MIGANFRGIVGMQYAEKSADTTRDTESKTDDPHLILPVAANGIYKIDGVILVTATGGNTKLGLTIVGPSGISGYFVLGGTVDTATGYTNSVTLNRRSFGSFIGNIAINGSAGAYPISGNMRVGATAGDCAVNWARHAGAAANPLVLQQYSWITLERVADL